MRIAQVVKTPQRRGAEIFALELCRELERRGHDTRVFYLHPPLGDKALPVRAGDAVLGAERPLLERLPGADPRLVRHLHQSLRDFAPNIVQVNGSRSVKYGSLARRLATGRWPLVGRLIGAPEAWAGGRVKRLAYGRLVLSAVDGVVAVSDGLVAELRRTYGWDGLATVIAGGVVNERAPSAAAAEARSLRGVPPGVPLLLFAGSLTHEKRPDRLLHAFVQILAELPSARLWIAGDGPLRSEVESRIAEAGLGKRVHLLGVVTELAPLYRAADLLVLSSDTEGTPGVILEAAVQGTPSVATDVGGVASAIRDGVTGRLVDRDDEAGLATAALRLLADDANRRRLGEAARRRVVEEFGIGSVAERYLNFYRRLADTEWRR